MQRIYHIMYIINFELFNYFIRKKKFLSSFQIVSIFYFYFWVVVSYFITHIFGKMCIIWVYINDISPFLNSYLLIVKLSPTVLHFKMICILWKQQSLHIVNMAKTDFTLFNENIIHNSFEYTLVNFKPRTWFYEFWGIIAEFSVSTIFILLYFVGRFCF